MPFKNAKKLFFIHSDVTFTLTDGKLCCTFNYSCHFKRMLGSKCRSLIFLVENIRWQRSGSCQTVVRQSSSSRQAVVRQSSGSCQAVIRQLSDSCQAAVRQSSGSHQAVFRQCSTHRCFMNFFTCGGIQCPRIQPRQPQGILGPLN